MVTCKEFESLDVVSKKSLLSRGGICFPGCPSELREPFAEAATALRAEDSFLRRAFARRTEWRASLRRGLAYKLFETTLVYLVFRKWLDRGRQVEWEFPYPKPHSKKAADLVLWPDSGRQPIAAIEVKWWLGNDKKTIPALRSDARKLDLWPAQTRVLLTFWWSPADRWERTGKSGDRQQIRDGLAKIGLKEQPLFLAAFDTDVPDTKGRDWYFAMLALDASARR